MLKAIVKTGTKITQIPGLGIWNMRCGGRGNCNACRITLIQGIFRVEGQIVNATSCPQQANACQTVLLSATGIIDIPPQALLPTVGSIAQNWQTAPLPNAEGESLACDLGTTTVAAVRLHGKTVLGKASTFNQQAQFGDNVIDRIAYATTHEKRNKLQKAAADSLNHCLQYLDCQSVKKIVIAGNTVMISLLWNVDPTAIGTAPFTPAVRHFPPISAGSIGLNLPPDATILAIPAISGFVGGDITAGISETNLENGELLLDLGTNCEMALNDEGRILCTTAAAGPAFEGAGITAGSRAIPGAIDHVKSDLTFSTIDDLPPVGLCGSAMVDFLAYARQLNLINRFGTFNAGCLPERQTIHNGFRAFSITPEIIITEKDIEQLLKAKAAIAAGLKALMHDAGHSLKDLKRIFLAGGFANFLDIQNAQTIEMLPNVPTTIVGNTALAGAARLALLPETLSELDHLADMPVDIPLATMPHFESLYTESLTLP